ncbi:glutathione S-transferase isoform X1 [Hydra vulgaris]|uniref:glutathione S-transferase isoform X1 n=2 Tax=Hydra vulgaris TaxID=6087 RepID=UPI00019258A8|nr:glutathione S-transferase [Hydra vulgaris]
MSPKYVLNYFNIQGKGEVARLLFHFKGVEFTDNQINFQDWPSQKSDQSRFPLGQMPTLEIDGHTVCQSAAINSYLAETFGLNGANASERLVINQVCETLNDFWNDYIEVWKNKTLDSDQKNAAFAELLVKETTKLKLSFLESLLKRNHDGHGYFVGDSITLGDLVFFHTTGMVDKSLLNDFPLLTELNNRVRHSAELKSYLDNRTHPPMP